MNMFVRCSLGVVLFLLVIAERAVATQYLFTIEDGAQPMDTSAMTEIMAFSTPTADDVYLDVYLGWTIPFFGSPYRRFLLSTNGAIIFNRNAPCCRGTTAGNACTFIDTLTGCNFTNAYDNAVLPCTLDLFPGKASTPLYNTTRPIMYRMHDNSNFTLYFNHVPVYVYATAYNETTLGPLPTYTFATTMHADGRIVNRYYDVRDPLTVPGNANSRPRDWLVGLRALGFSDQNPQFAAEWGMLRNVSYVTSLNGSICEVLVNQTYVNGTAQGGVLVNTTCPTYGNIEMMSNGTYVPRSAIVSNTTLTFCPIGSEFCITPSFGSITGGDTVFLTTTDWTCASKMNINFTCLFTGNGIENEMMGHYNESLDALQCSTPAVLTPGQVTVKIRHYGYISGSVTMSNQVNYTYVAVNDPRLAGRGNWSAMCDECAPFLRSRGDMQAPFCIKDCANVWFGKATYDNCSVCSGGSTGHVANSDKNCRGQCFGPDFTPELCACAPPKELVYYSGKEEGSIVVECDLPGTVETTSIRVTLNPIRGYQGTIAVVVALAIVALTALYGYGFIKGVDVSETLGNTYQRRRPMPPAGAPAPGQPAGGPRPPAGVAQVVELMSPPMQAIPR